MITLSVKEFEGERRLFGTINKKPFNVLYSDSAKETLLGLSFKMNNVETIEQFNDLVSKSMNYIDSISTSVIIEVANTDLFHDKAKNQYFLKVGKVISKIPVHKVIVSLIQTAVDLDLDPTPWIKFWARWMRNPNLTADKTEYMMAYIKAKFTDNDKKSKLIKEGYSEEMATEIATFNQISITNEGLLAAFKYVSLKDTTKHIEVDKETGEQVVVTRKQKLKADGIVTIDANDNIIKSDGKAFLAEDLIFVPPIMGNSGDSFTCEPLAKGNKFNDFSGHVIRVGQRHRLENFSQVNCVDNTFGGKGLHVGGYHYVKGYGGRTKLLVDCLVDPAHIGGFSNLVNYTETAGAESAIRVLEYYVVGTHFAVQNIMFHPSKYAELLDEEWAEFKSKAIEKADKLLGEISEW